MTKWQVRSNAFTRRGKPTVSIIEATHIKPLDGGGLAFVDEYGVISAMLQKDSWNDVVRVPES